jgi:spore maturation protein CgeB
LKIHNEVSFPVSLELIADSKILLNIMPWFKGGIHDRVLSAMVNKTVCISDTNEYLEENFVEGENILLYCFDHLEALPEKINHLLSNPMKAKEIAECGYEEAITHHMWKNRIEETIHKIR